MSINEQAREMRTLPDEFRVIIAGGGTGGHIYPGVAIAREFKERNSTTEILFVGTARGLEAKIVPREGFKLELIDVAALKNVSLGKKVASLSRLPKSFFTVRSLLKKYQPDVVIGVGGYSSGPVLLIASLIGSPTMVVEPNAMPGFTNRVLARFIKAAAVTFPDALPFFKGKGTVTGNPVRSDFATVASKPRGARTHVLIFGGSQGAHAINVAMTEVLAKLKEQSKLMSFSFTHQTGETDLAMVKEAYEKFGAECEVKPFIHEMVKEFGRADIVICRAGATTSAEVAAAGKAAIMIPFPFAADDHQRKNAEAMERAGAVKMILQQNLTGDSLAKELLNLASDPEAITRMEVASRQLAKGDAAARTVDLALKISREQ